jgi:hypothetical protein
MVANLPRFRVQALSHQAPLMEVGQKRLVFTNFVYSFLSRDDLTGTLSPVAVLSCHLSCCGSLSILQSLSVSLTGALFNSPDVQSRSCLPFQIYKQL